MNSRFFIIGIINGINDYPIFNGAILASEKTKIITKIDSNTIRVNSKFFRGYIGEIIDAKIILNKKFADQLYDIILSQIPVVKETPTKYGLEEGNYFEVKKGSFKSMLHGLVFYVWHYSIDNISVLDIALDLMISIVRNHYMNNGNKRLGLLTMGVFLSSVGLYLKLKYRNKDYLRYWEEIMINIASGKYGIELEEIKNAILYGNVSLKDYIKDNLFLVTKSYSLVYINKISGNVYY